MAKKGIGIPLSLDADETTFTRALRAISAESKKTAKEVNEIDKALVLNPNSTILLTQKQQMLSKSITDTKNTLTALTSARDKADADMGKGVEVNEVQYRKLQREILTTANNLKSLNAQASGNALSKPLDSATASAKKFDSSIDNAKSSTKQLNSEVTKTSTQASKLSSSMGSVLKGVVAGYTGKALVEYLIGSNAQMEQYTTSFEVMLGSASKSKALMADLTNFANTTPLQLTDVTQNATLLLNYGVAADDVLDKLRQLGDVSLGNADKLNRISLAYGQMLAKGKVTGEELRQMTEAGVPLNKALADALGTSTAELAKMIETGKVGIPTLDKAIGNLTSGTGQFAGMMEKQSKTMNGMLSTLKDNFAQFGRDIGEEAFSDVKVALSDLMDEIDRMKSDGTLKQITEDLGNSLANIIKLMIEMGKSNTWVQTAKGMGEFASAITSISDKIEGLKSKSEIFSKLKKLVDETFNPFVRLADANDDLLKSFNENVDKYKDNTTELSLLGFQYDETTKKIIKFNDAVSGSTSHKSASGGTHGGTGSSFVGETVTSMFAGMEADAKANYTSTSTGVEEIADAYKTRKDKLKIEKDRGIIDDGIYYTKMESLLSEYTTNENGVYANEFTEIYQGRKSLNEKVLSEQETANKKLTDEQEKVADKQVKINEDNLKTWETGFDKLADTGIKAFEEIEKKQEDFADKLAKTGDLFTIKDDTMNINNISDQTEQLKKYQVVLEQLKTAGASKDFMAQFTSMDTTQGLDYGKTILSGNISQYFAEFEEKQKVANQIATDYYAEDTATLKTEFTDQIKANLQTMPDIANGIGQDTATEFIKGMQSKLSELNTAMNIMAQQSMTATVKTSVTGTQGATGGVTPNIGTITNQQPQAVTLQPISLILDDNVVAQFVFDCTNKRTYQTGGTT